MSTQPRHYELDLGARGTAPHVPRELIALLKPLGSQVVLVIGGVFHSPMITPHQATRQGICGRIFQEVGEDGEATSRICDLALQGRYAALARVVCHLGCLIS